MRLGLCPRAPTGTAEQAVNTQLGMYFARHAAGQSKWIEDVFSDWWFGVFLQ